MNDSTFLRDRPWKRRDDRSPLVEVTRSKDHDIRAAFEPPQGLGSSPGIGVRRIGVVVDDHGEIEIAVRIAVAPGLGPEEIDPQRLIHLDDAADDLREIGGVAGFHGEDDSGRCSGANQETAWLIRPFTKDGPPSQNRDP